jgi:DNA-binding ferritin-like protein
VTETNQQATLVESVGTISQSMSDVSERMRMLGERAPLHAVWQTQLALGESDFGRADFSHAFDQANESLDRLSRLAETSPEQLRAGIVDLRKSMLAISDRFDTSWARMMQTVEEQRVALAANVRDEREAAVLAIDAQRAALAKDAERITDQAITAGGVQVRSLVREVILYGILLFIVLFGLPFAAGYFIGHLRGTRAKAIG